MLLVNLLVKGVAMVSCTFGSGSLVGCEMAGVFRAAMIGVSVVVLPLSGAPLAGQQVIEDPVTCESCSLELSLVTRIGEMDGPGALPGAPRSVEIDSQDRIWLLFNDVPPMVFDRDGDLIQPVGRMGEGPGEFLYPGQLARAADSMLIYDRVGRIVVVGPDLSPARSIRIRSLTLHDLQVIDWPHSVLVSGSARSAALAGWYLHLLDLGGDEADVERSFGENEGALLARGSDRAEYRQLTVSSDGGAWALRRTSRYALSRWGPDGTLEASLVRRSELFPEGFDGLGGGPDVEPSPRLRAIHEGSESLLWVLGDVPRPDWRDGWSRAGIEELPRSATEVPTHVIPDLFDLREPVLEVLDPDSRTVVWRGKPDLRILDLIQGDRMVTYHVTDAGVPVVEILHFELETLR